MESLETILYDDLLIIKHDTLWYQVSESLYWGIGLRFGFWLLFSNVVVVQNQFMATLVACLADLEASRLLSL